MELVYALSWEHPVYTSLKQTLQLLSHKLPDCSLVCPGRLENSFFGTAILPSIPFYRLNLQFSKKNIYILNSPSRCIDGWEGLIKNIPLFLVEEYLKDGSVKDAFFSFLISPFRGRPFINLTKRTHSFLTEHGFTSYHIPPATQKRKGSRNRDLVLYVGRLEKNKNPFLVLKIAKLMRESNFVMIGNGSLLGQVREQAKGLGNLEIIESIESREQLFRDYYAKARVLLHPAHQDPIGFVIIEALSTSTPVLASGAAGASDYLPREWVIGDVRNPKKWVEKLGLINSESVKSAVNIFEQENLNITSPYFSKTADDMFKYIKERNWL